MKKVPLRGKILMLNIFLLIIILTANNIYLKSTLDGVFLKFNKNVESEIRNIIKEDSPQDIKQLETLLSQLDKEREEVVDFLDKRILFITIIFLITALFIYYFMADRISKPIREIIATIDTVTKGDLKKRAKVYGDDHLGDVAEKLNTLIENLNSVERMKKEFLARNLNELRTPLSGILGVSESLLDEDLGQLNIQQKNNLELIHENSSRLIKVVNRLNDFSILNKKETKLELRTVNIKKLIDESILTLSSKLKEKNIIVKNNIPENLAFIRGDNNGLYQIFNNIIENAIKFTESGEIIVTAEEFVETIEVSVIDTGSGIPESKLENIFNSFEKATEKEGAGLGLTITKKLVELHGGKIGIDSEVGRGTTVSIIFQRSFEKFNKEKQLLDKIKQEVESLNVVNSTRSQHRILIVENDPVNLQVIVNYLSIRNYSINVATSTNEMFKYLALENFDLVIIDSMVSEVTGHEVVKKIRRRFSAFKLPVVMLFTSGSAMNLSKYFENGLNEYLEKPLHKKEFLIKVDSMLRLKNSLEEVMNVNKKYMQEKKDRIVAENLRYIHTELTSTLDVKEVFAILFKKIKYLLDYDSAIVLLKQGGRYKTIFQDGNLDKAEKNDRLFQSRYLDPITNNDRLIVLNEYKCQKYFPDRIKSAIVLPVKYGHDERCVIILKSTEIKYFKNMEKEKLDNLFYQMNIAIKNATLYQQVEDKNTKLEELFTKIKTIEKLVSVIYNEKDKKTAIYYILLIIINKLELNYKEAFFFEYNSEKEMLECLSYYYNLNRISEETEDNVAETELWTRNLRIPTSVTNVITQKFFSNSNEYLYDVKNGQNVLIEKLENITVLPISYENNKYGVLVLEGNGYKTFVDDEEKEILKIFTLNLGIYLHSKLLEENEIKYEKIKTMGKFAQSIVHELRTPLVGIKGFASMVKEKFGSRSEKFDIYIEGILKESDRVLDIVSQVLDYVENDENSYQFKQEDLSKIILNVLDSYKLDLEENDIELTLKLEKILVKTAKIEIEKAFKHIIKNAIENVDYSKNSNYLKIEMVEFKDYYRISFEDNGVGIKKDILDNIYKPLVSTKLQGTGLGLTLSKSIIEKHGWNIMIISTHLEKTMVVLQIPKINDR